jgi:hypothetical protein
VDLARIARIGVDEHQLADVVEQRGDHQPVTGLVADLARQPVSGALGGDGMQAEAFRDPLPHPGPLEEVKCPGPAGDGVHGLRREHLNAGHRAVHPPGHRPVDLVGQTHDGDRQGSVSLDSRYELRG